MDKNLDTVEAKAVIQLLETLEEFGLSPKIVETFTGINHRRVYRWAGSETLFFKLTMAETEGLIWFCEQVQEIKENWMDIVTRWNGQLHKAVKLSLYRKPYLRILRSQIPFDEKIKTLVKMTFHEWEKNL